MSQQANHEDKVTSNTTSTAKSGFTLPLQTEQSKSPPVKAVHQTEIESRPVVVETPSSVVSPMSEGSANSELSLEDELTAGEEVREEDHMTHLAVHSSFSALDTKTSSHESLNKSLSPTKEETTSIGSKQEVNHNEKSKGEYYFHH